MSTAASAPSGPQGVDHYKLRVNTVDRTKSLLVSLLVFSITVFVALLIVFLFRTFSPRITAKPIEIFDPGDPGDAPKGYADEPDPPGLEDAPELIEPQLQDTLSAISNVAAAKAAMLSDQVLDAAEQAGRGSGLGDARNTGVGGGGGDDCPKEMKYEPVSLSDYKALLDHFEVELGVLDPRTNQIYYAKNLRSPNPTTRVGTPQEERAQKRFNFRSTGEPLKGFEIQIARDAGIMKSGAIVLTFWPEQRKNEFYGIERERMNQNNISDRSQVKKTVYRFFRVGSAYDFEVESQTYF